MKLRIGKGFLSAGFVPVTGGDAVKALGSALAAFLFAPTRSTSGLPMLRVRVGSRVTVLERRAHGTPTGRCSRGHWERIDDAPTPGRAAEWSKLGKFWAWRIAESVEVFGPRAPWDWGTDPGKSLTACHTTATPNAHHPTLAGGQGRGRRGKGTPAIGDAFGFSPASGRRAGTHDPAKVEARIYIQNKVDAAIRREFRKVGV